MNEITVEMARLAYECALIRKCYKPIMELETLYKMKLDELYMVMKQSGVQTYRVPSTNLEARLYRDGAGLVPITEPRYEPIPDHDRIFHSNLGPPLPLKSR